MADPVITTTYEVGDESLTIIETPDQPVSVRRHVNIKELRAEKKRINAAINAWQEKKEAVQALIDLYTANGGV